MSMILDGSTDRRTSDILGNRFYLAGIGLALSAFFIFSADQVLRIQGFDNGMITHGEINAKENPESNLDQSENINNTTTSPPSQDPGLPHDDATSSTNSVGTQATVLVDGESITSSIDANNPNQSVNKTVTTDDGYANVSVQQQSNTNGDGTTRSSNRVQVNSNSSGRTNTSVQLNQSSTGGIPH